MESELTTKPAKKLYAAIASLKSSREAQAFLRDLCTLSELEAMAERLQVAGLVDGARSYRAISRQTGSSTATITRVAHWLHHGQGGYRLVLDRMK